MIKQAIDTVLEDWAYQFISSIQKRAAAIPSATGAGASSFDIDVLKTSSSGAAMVIADFADYLRHFDMRPANRREKNFNADTMQRLKDWIERKGVTNFLKGYKYPTQVREKGGRIVDVSTTRIINNIAWGISRTRKRSKRIKWYNSKKGGDVYRLYAKLVDAVVEAGMREIKENITNNRPNG